MICYTRMPHPLLCAIHGCHYSFVMSRAITTKVIVSVLLILCQPYQEPVIFRKKHTDIRLPNIVTGNMIPERNMKYKIIQNAMTRIWYISDNIPHLTSAEVNAAPILAGTDIVQRDARTQMRRGFLNCVFAASADEPIIDQRLGICARDETHTNSLFNCICLVLRFRNSYQR